jgi:hypothetical protein
MQAFEQGLISLDSLKDEDIFEIQHHHLLKCLEMATEREATDTDITYDEYGSSQTPPPSFPISTRPKNTARDRSSMLSLANCCISGDNETRNKSQKSQKSTSTYHNDHSRMNRQRHSTILETDIESEFHETIHLHENSKKSPQTSNNTLTQHETVAMTNEDQKDETSIV